MAETQVLGWGTQSAPASRRTKPAENFELLVVDAQFDGTGAAGDFIPALQVLSDAGAEVGMFPAGDTVTAGDAAAVTFGPFLGRGGGTVSLSNPIGFYDVTPLAGNPAPAGAHNSVLQIVFSGAGSGTDLMDTTTRGPDAPQPKAAGMYAFNLRLGFAPSGVPNFTAGDWGQLDLSTNNEPPPENFQAQEATLGPLEYHPLSGYFLTVGFLRYIDPAVAGGGGGSNYLVLTASYNSTPPINLIGNFSVQQVY